MKAPQYPAYVLEENFKSVRPELVEGLHCLLWQTPRKEEDRVSTDSARTEIGEAVPSGQTDLFFVTPAKAGVSGLMAMTPEMPASVGMTNKYSTEIMPE
ncbi:hypothetical protein [Novosphingopyxis sp.]|uniref:hypothetical protein n=1 Tax=Novosphingopyxis sp. TaxID=2709690 RepID=UPI003B59E74E